MAATSLGPVARALLSPKQRMQLLSDEVVRLRGQLYLADGVSVLRVARCGHPECGCEPPVEAPAEALLIELGCRYQIPSVTPPEGHEQGYRSRVERGIPTAGPGIGEEGVRATIQLISVLNRLLLQLR